MQWINLTNLTATPKIGPVSYNVVPSIEGVVSILAGATPALQYTETYAIMVWAYVYMNSK